ncbi:hypothetical protein N7448_004563 [Penicillium atrosanguineum]|uniref:Uncharacterized protein n=1 Tax=Penicillium atrosanguineum TaxID=1132637 RepID=A0A9W9H1Q4_9EURO|nr:uncharacterized protein N7443_008314 [Penicillium atrosanguineum]KAJ5125236.1 hypothetical protein N7526_007413 [Penicillium atrosanguineum]KAJ5136009.1 hypothetical protein N7448_004563 [Penicillium atrosanguineum]KAJ5292361.1 hypothetical protein N7443_008314 [Penicillium atrosanguineum]KAJ5303618.1 hypothetical protein N7476_010417 [Penicillium atrosanguineum]
MANPPNLQRTNHTVTAVEPLYHGRTVIVSISLPGPRSSLSTASLRGNHRPLPHSYIDQTIPPVSNRAHWTSYPNSDVQVSTNRRNIIASGDGFNQRYSADLRLYAAALRHIAR